MDTCTNGEVYNLVIHGGAKGGLDGIDVWGTNIWIHDVEVSNKDECVTVKNPSRNLLIESIHCNRSGGCAMGSLATGTDIRDVEYRNVYTHGSNQMYMIKSYGGSGTVSNVRFDNFWGHSNAYSLDFDTQWSSMSPVDGDGIEYANITFSGWRGTCADGVQRGPVKLNCPAAVPCTDIVVDDFGMWTEAGSKVLYACNNAYGEGACMRAIDAAAGPTAYSSTVTLTTATAAYALPTTMDNELAAGWPTTASIPVPTLPASFFPGIPPKSAVLGRGEGAAAAGGAISAATTTSSGGGEVEQTPVFETLSMAEGSSSASSVVVGVTSSGDVSAPKPTAPVSHCKRHLHKRH
jgi:rhamnogalacturonan hydrolase